MNNSCYIGCKHLHFREWRPNLCTNVEAIREHGSVIAKYYDCPYCEERPSLQKRLQIILEIEEDLVEESNRMWRGRFAIGCIMCISLFIAVAFAWSLL